MTDDSVPLSWTMTDLESCAQIVLGQSPPGESYNSDGLGTPFFQGKAEFGERHPVVRKWTTAPTKFAEADDILLSVRAPVGPTNLAPTACAIGRGLAAIRPFQGVGLEYLLWSLRATADRLAGEGAGSTFLAVTGQQVRRHRIALAPEAEQKRIVAELERRFAHLDAVEQGLRISMSKLVAASDATIRAAALPVRYQGDDLPELSDGWEWTTLGEAAEVVGGVTKDSKRQNDPEYVEVPYLRVANVQRGFLALDEVATIRVPPRKAASLRLQNGDLLFNEGGDRDKLGRGWVWHGEIDDCIHQNHVFRARLTDSRLVPEMVSWWGNTFGRFWFESHGKQTTNLASINLKTLKSFPVPVPPSGEGPVRVTEAQRRLSIIEACAHDVKRSIERIAVLRRSLLVAAFSGRLVPQDPDDEPASELLARIAKTRAEAEAAEKEAKAAARRAKKAAKETMA